MVGDVTGLLGALREDVVSHAEGGLNPIFGAGKSRDSSAALSPVVVALYLNGQIESLFSSALDAEGRVETIFVIRNPEKLDSIASLPR